MINPINFRANAGNVTLETQKQEEVLKSAPVTTPVANSASFKGADAMSSYNKAMIGLKEAEPSVEKAPVAFKGDENAPAETESKEEAVK